MTQSEYTTLNKVSFTKWLAQKSKSRLLGNYRDETDEMLMIILQAVQFQDITAEDAFEAVQEYILTPQYRDDRGRKTQDNTMLSLGERIIAFRAKHNMTQLGFANRIKETHTLIWRCEQGMPIRPVNAERISNKLKQLESRTSLIDTINEQDAPEFDDTVTPEQKMKFDYSTKIS